MNVNYFTNDEITCKCGCGANNLRQSTLDKMNNARQIAGIQFITESVCRCPKHNKAEGGEDDSAHISMDIIQCKAFDIRALNSRNRAKILIALVKTGFHRIGIAKTFIHADDDETKPPEVVWLY